MTNVSHANTSLFSRLPVPQASPPYKRIHRTCCILLRSYCRMFASYSQSQEDLAKEVPIPFYMHAYMVLHAFADMHYQITTFSSLPAWGVGMG
jgi:hypothetical protein